MAGNAIRHGTYVEPTLVDSVDFWESREAERYPPVKIMGELQTKPHSDYFDRFDRIGGLFGYAR